MNWGNIAFLVLAVIVFVVVILYYLKPELFKGRKQHDLREPIELGIENINTDNYLTPVEIKRVEETVDEEIDEEIDEDIEPEVLSLENTYVDLTIVRDAIQTPESTNTQFISMDQDKLQQISIDISEVEIYVFSKNPQDIGSIADCYIKFILTPTQYIINGKIFNYKTRPAHIKIKKTKNATVVYISNRGYKYEREPKSVLLISKNTRGKIRTLKTMRI